MELQLYEHRSGAASSKSKGFSLVFFCKWSLNRDEHKAIIVPTIVDF